MSKTLDSIGEGRRAVVMDISGDAGIRQHLYTLGIHIGDVISVKRYAPWGGPILIGVHGSEVALGKNIASMIKVKEL